MKTFPIFELTGTAYEIGLAHGRLAQKQVRISLENYRKQFQDEANISWEDAKVQAPRFLRALKKYDPTMLDEMHGISEGAGVDFEDILTLNARSEVLMTLKASGSDLQDGCTNIAVSKERTENGHTLLAHNWDWKQAQSEATIVLKIHQQNKPDILMLTEGGIIGKFGINSSGIAVAMNALRTPGCIEGVPVHCVLRGILNSTTLGDAIAAIVSYPTASSSNYLLAGSCGEVLDCERVGEDYSVIYPENDLLTHANYITSERLQIKYKDNVALGDCSSFIRQHRSAKLLRNQEKISIAHLKRVLSDHADEPRSICAHPKAGIPAYLARCTVCTLVIDTDERSMEICPGNPCCGEFYKVIL